MTAADDAVATGETGAERQQRAALAQQAAADGVKAAEDAVAAAMRKMEEFNANLKAMGIELKDAPGELIATRRMIVLEKLAAEEKVKQARRQAVKKGKAPRKRPALAPGAAGAKKRAAK